MIIPETAQAAFSSTVLLVDDQLSIVRALELGLRRRQFSVLSANNGRDALAILGSEQAVDILVSDIVMPGGISGFELARLAQKLRPGLPLLLTTGYSYDQVETPVGQTNGYEIMRKPFSVVDLVMRINNLLLPRSEKT